MTTRDLLARIRGVPGLTVGELGVALSQTAAEAILRAAGLPPGPPLIEFYTQLNGAALTRPDLELRILSLDEFAATPAWAHMQEYSGLPDDAEEAEDFAGFHVFAMRERSLWLCDPRTLETAVAFDFDVEPLSLRFGAMIDALIERRFAPGWHRAYRR